MASLTGRESSFCEKGLSNVILRALYTQRQEKTFCDVNMRVGGSELFVHSVVLAAASPYFANFLTQDLPRHFSQRSPQIIEIQIDGSDTDTIYKEAVESVIDFIYTGILVLNTQNVSQVSELARIMQIEKVVKFCEDFILNRKDSSHSPRVIPARKTTSVNVGVCTGADDTDDEYPTLTSKKNSPGPPGPGTQSRVMFSPSQRIFKPGRLISASTQVNPMLLGILPPSPKVVKDSKTQTMGKDFPEKVKGYQGGRFSRKKPCNPIEETEIVVEITRDSKSATSVRLLNNTATESENGLIPIDQEVDVDYRSSNTELLSSYYSGNETEIRDISLNEAYVVTESDNNVGVTIVNTENDDLGGENRRRSGRRPKPTPKILALKRPPTSPPKGTALKVRQVEFEADERSDPTIQTVPSLGTSISKKSPRKTKLIPREDNVDLPSEQVPPEETSEVIPKKEKPDEEIGHGNMDEEQLLKELVLNEEEFIGPDSQLPRIHRKPRRFVPRKHRKGHFKFTCSECDFRTNKVREFTSHKRLHKMENNICYYCERKFEHKDELTEHFQRHKGPLPFYCPVCECRYKSRTQLNIHLPKHSDDKPFVCEVCSAGFKWKHALKSHMIVHSNRKDHLCDECGYATAHKCQLKAHKLIHTGQTYRCPFTTCRFQATKRQNLKYHLLTHTREKPHQCEICGQSFSLIKNMRRHMLLHSTDKPHHCNECNFSTTRYDKLKEHMLKSHGMGSPPEKRVRVADLVQQNMVDSETGVEIGDNALGMGFRDGTVITSSGESALAGESIGMTAEEIAQATSGATEVAVLNEAQMQFLPGQTIIITQTGQDGEVQTHEVTLSPQTGILETATGDQVQNGVQFTEVMIPSNQLNDYVQDLAFVGDS